MTCNRCKLRRMQERIKQEQRAKKNQSAAHKALPVRPYKVEQKEEVAEAQVLDAQEVETSAPAAVVLEPETPEILSAPTEEEKPAPAKRGRKKKTPLIEENVVEQAITAETEEKN